MYRLPYLLSLAAILLPASAAASGGAPQAAPAAAVATPVPAWQAAIDQRRAALIANNGPGEDATLRAQLLAMRDQDQRARGLDAHAAHTDHVEVATNLAEIDAALTAQLKQIVETVGWPTIRRVGIDGSDAAMLVLTHTRDHAWQQSLLPKLESLADAQQIDPSALAMVIDKELVAEGKLQRYGTQFKRVADGIAMYGVEDPAGLDKLRAQVMLPPIEVYKQQLAGMYHLKATNQIVLATPPAK